MTVILQYFWLLGIVVGPVFATLVHFEFQSVVDKNPELQPARRFRVISAGLLLSIPYVLLYICQLLGGSANPGFVLTSNIQNKWVLLALVVVVLTHIAALYVFRNWQVAELISRLQYVRGSKQSVRFWAQIIVLGCLIANLSAAYLNLGAK